MSAIGYLKRFVSRYVRGYVPSARAYEIFRPNGIIHYIVWSGYWASSVDATLTEIVPAEPR